MLGASRDKLPEGDIEAKADPAYPPSHASPHERRQPNGSQESGRAPDETNSTNSKQVRIVNKETHHEPASSKDSNQNDAMDISQQELGQRATERDDRLSDNRRQRSHSLPPTTNVQDFAPASPSSSLHHIRQDGRRPWRDQLHDRAQPSRGPGGEIDHNDGSPRPGNGDDSRRESYTGAATGSRRQSQTAATDTLTLLDSPGSPALPRVRRRPRSLNSETHGTKMTERELLRSRDDNHGSSFANRLRRFYKESVIDVKEGRVRVNLAEFNRVILEFSQKRLVDAAFEFSYGRDYDEDESDDEDEDEDFTCRAEEYMSQYVSAWKNLEFMTEARKKKGYDPFVVSTNYVMQRELLKHVEEDNRTWVPMVTIDVLNKDMEELANDDLHDAVDKDRVLPFGGRTRSSSNRKAMIEEYTRKVVMAMIGGTFLVAPMLVMVLRPSLVTSLVTTSVCVFLFGLVMSKFLDKPFDVLSGTAAYAAVLVVFIGTGGGT